MLERDVVGKIRKHLAETYGATHHKATGGAFGEMGASDLYGTLPGGRAYYIEIKVPGKKPKKPTPQSRWLDKERTIGAVAGFATSIDDVDELMHNEGVDPILR